MKRKTLSKPYGARLTPELAVLIEKLKHECGADESDVLRSLLTYCQREFQYEKLKSVILRYMGGVCP